MKRVLVILACLCGMAWAGEVLKDDNGRVLVPVAKVACVPLFEVKDVRIVLCRVTGTPEFAFAVKVIFVHHVSSTVEVTATVDMNEGGSALFRKPVLTQYASRVKPNTPTTICLLSERALTKDADFVTRITLTPRISFAFTRSPAE